MTSPVRPTLVSCPRCGQQCEFAPTNPYRPFCSERCKLGDLGAWASERYRVAAPPTDEPDATDDS
ncbi:MAG TPA: DNA gyrase inhibitor YacG [Methylibium sp.]|nr:DNA gyrase inhibitor YacG [Methylibium sp.]